MHPQYGCLKKLSDIAILRDTDALTHG